MPPGPGSGRPRRRNASSDPLSGDSSESDTSESDPTDTDPDPAPAENTGSDTSTDTSTDAGNGGGESDGVADSARKAVHRANQKAREVEDTAESAADTARENTQQAREAAHRANQKAQAVEDTARETADSAQDRVEEAREQVHRENQQARETAPVISDTDDSTGGSETPARRGDDRLEAPGGPPGTGSGPAGVDGSPAREDTTSEVSEQTQSAQRRGALGEQTTGTEPQETVEVSGQTAHAAVRGALGQRVASRAGGDMGGEFSAEEAITEQVVEDSGGTLDPEDVTVEQNESGEYTVEVGGRYGRQGGVENKMDAVTLDRQHNDRGDQPGDTRYNAVGEIHRQLLEKQIENQNEGVDADVRRTASGGVEVASVTETEGSGSDWDIIDKAQNEVSPTASFVDANDDQMAVRKQREEKYASEASGFVDAVTSGKLPSAAQTGSAAFQAGESVQHAGVAAGGEIEGTLPLDGVGPTVGGGGNSVGTQTEKALAGLVEDIAVLGGGAVQGVNTIPRGVAQIATGERSAASAAGDVGQYGEQTVESQASYFADNPVEFAVDFAAGGAAVKYGAGKVNSGTRSAVQKARNTDSSVVQGASARVKSGVDSARSTVQEARVRSPSVRLEKDADAGAVEVDSELTRQIQSTADKVRHAYRNPKTESASRAAGESATTEVAGARNPGGQPLSSDLGTQGISERVSQARSRFSRGSPDATGARNPLGEPMPTSLGKRGMSERAASATSSAVSRATDVLQRDSPDAMGARNPLGQPTPTSLGQRGLTERAVETATETAGKAKRALSSERPDVTAPRNPLGEPTATSLGERGFVERAAGLRDMTLRIEAGKPARRDYTIDANDVEVSVEGSLPDAGMESAPWMDDTADTADTGRGQSGENASGRESVEVESRTDSGQVQVQRLGARGGGASASPETGPLARSRDTGRVSRSRSGLASSGAAGVFAGVFDADRQTPSRGKTFDAGPTVESGGSLDFDAGVGVESGIGIDDRAGQTPDNTDTTLQGGGLDYGTDTGLDVAARTDINQRAELQRTTKTRNPRYGDLDLTLDGGVGEEAAIPSGGSDEELVQEFFDPLGGQ